MRIACPDDDLKCDPGMWEVQGVKPVGVGQHGEDRCDVGDGVLLSERSSDSSLQWVRFLFLWAGVVR